MTTTTTTTTLAAWRAQRTQGITLPSGLPVRLRKVQLMDLAARGQIPTPLLDQVQVLMDAAEGGGMSIALADFERYATVIDLVVSVALVDPPVADEPDDKHVSVAELPFSDRLEIFNWAQQEAAQMATFPGGAGGGERAARGRQRLRTAPVERPSGGVE